MRNKERQQGRERKPIYGDPVFVFLYNHFETFARSWPIKKDLEALGLEKIKSAPIDTLAPICIKVRDVILRTAACPSNLNPIETSTLVDCIKLAPDFTLGALVCLREKYKGMCPVTRNSLFLRDDGKLTNAEKQRRSSIRRQQEEFNKKRAKAFEGSELDVFAKGSESVRAFIQKWNKAHPEARVQGNKK